jgi:guanyl-specific ribonuclease Sa
VAPIQLLTAWAADPSANAAANRPASTVPKPRNNDAANTSSNATVAPRKAMSMVESIIRSGPFV